MTSRLEERLGQELRALAERLAPGDLRPLRQPPERSGWFSAHLVAPVSVMVAVVVVAGGLMVTRSVLHARAAGGPAASQAAADPADLAVAGSVGIGLTSDVKLISASTGRIVQTVAQTTVSNGMALAPDGRSLFVVAPSLKLRQVSLTTGKSSYLASGAYPAVSPNSRFVAYATGTGFTKVAIRDLRSGQTRAISLSALVGAGSSVLNRGGLTWLGDGTELVAVSEPDPVTVSAPVSRWVPDPVRRTTCGQQDSPRGLCVIVVNVAARRLSARSIFVRGLPGDKPVALLSGDLAAQQDFFIAQASLPVTAVSRVSLHRGGAAARTLVTLPEEAIAEAVAPAGDRVVFLTVGVSGAGVSFQAQLKVARVRAGQLTGERTLLASATRFHLTGAAW